LESLFLHQNNAEMVRIFLVGYMGAGKTTLGKAFAKTMNLSFIDLDWYIEERFHKTIKELFALYGEEKYRLVEQRMLHEVSEIEDVVIATGGGTPCFFDNMEYMNGAGETVFLDVNVEVLYVRLTIAHQNRPVLKGKEGDELRSFITESLEKRAPYYSLAKYTFDGSKLETKMQIAQSVCNLQQLLSMTPQEIHN
jgi:shikimate kinase